MLLPRSYTPWQKMTSVASVWPAWATPMTQPDVILPSCFLLLYCFAVAKACLQVREWQGYCKRAEQLWPGYGPQKQPHGGDHHLRAQIIANGGVVEVEAPLGAKKTYPGVPAKGTTTIELNYSSNMKAKAKLKTPLRALPQELRSSVSHNLGAPLGLRASRLLITDQCQRSRDRHARTSTKFSLRLRSSSASASPVTYPSKRIPWAIVFLHLSLGMVDT